MKFCAANLHCIDGDDNSSPAHALEIPETPKRPVTTAYFGTAIVDDYIWLENFDDPDVKKWNTEENQAARGYLDKLPDTAEGDEAA